jgi:D-apionate oxidoisomerase
MRMSLTVALFGAGGKMGGRITNNLKDSAYRMLYVEVNPGGIQRLAEKGITPTAHQQACEECDVAILALPDSKIGIVAPGIVPQHHTAERCRSARTFRTSSRILVIRR